MNNKDLVKGEYVRDKELKRLHAGTGAVHTGSGTQLLNPIAQGSGCNQRIGKKVYLHSIDLKVQVCVEVQNNNTTFDFNAFNEYGFGVVACYNRGPSNPYFDWSYLYNNIATPCGQRIYGNTRDIVVLRRAIQFIDVCLPETTTHAAGSGSNETEGTIDGGVALLTTEVTFTPGASTTSKICYKTFSYEWHIDLDGLTTEFVNDDVANGELMCIVHKAGLDNFKWSYSASLRYYE